MSEKIVGYLLIAIGIVTIILSTISVYDVFARKAEPVKPFAFSGISMDSSQLIAANLPQGMTLPKGPAIEVIPASMVNDSSNLFAHVVLMGFIASGGLKLATIGTQLVRPIMVKVNMKEATTAV